MMMSKAANITGNLDKKSQSVLTYRIPLLVLFFGLVLAICKFYYAINYSVSIAERHFYINAHAIVGQIDTVLKQQQALAQIVSKEIKFMHKGSSHLTAVQLPEEMPNIAYMSMDVISKEQALQKITFYGNHASGHYTHVNTTTGREEIPQTLFENQNIINYLPVTHAYYLETIVNLDELLNSLLKQSNFAEKINIYVFQDKKNDAKPLFQYIAQTSLMPNTVTTYASIKRFSSQFVEEPLNFGEHRWHVVFQSNAGDQFQGVGFFPWFLLFVAIFFTILVSFFLLLITQKNQKNKLMLATINQQSSAMEDMVEALQRSNDELQKFAYVASHDLKSPMRAIDNIAQWLEEDLGDHFDEKSKNHMKNLHGRVARMNKLLDDLLEYSRAGRVTKSYEIVPLETIITNITNLLDVPPHIKVSCDESIKKIELPTMPLSQVFQNLVDNAVKHHNKDVGNITITGGEEGSFYRFSVTDDGPGIDEAYHSKIFEIFQTLKPRDEVEGCGMGLALIKKIIEMHQGSITVQSRVGEGTSFTFTWPKNFEEILSNMKKKESYESK